MKDKKLKFGAGIGIGYVTVMMIFSVICLTVFAALSLKASGAGSGLYKKSADFTMNYYSADARAKEILSQLDEAAYEGRVSGFFEDAFAYGEFPDGVTVSRVPEGFRAEYAVPVNEKMSLAVSVIFYDERSEQRYSIEKWKNVSSSSAEEETHLNVWDGGI